MPLIGHLFARALSGRLCRSRQVTALLSRNTASLSLVRLVNMIGLMRLTHKVVVHKALIADAQLALLYVVRRKAMTFAAKL